MLSLNYLELTLYYSKKNTTIFNIINLGDFIYNLRIEELNTNKIAMTISHNAPYKAIPVLTLLFISDDIVRM